MLTPFVVSSFATVPNLRSASPDLSKLQNPYRSGALLDEITVYVTHNVLFSGRAVSGFSVDLKLGRIPLTKDRVKLSLIAWPPRLGELTALHCTIRFPRPLFVPYNSYVLPTFFMDTSIGAAAQVDCVYNMRALEQGSPAPQIVYAPWFSQYSGPLLTSNTVPTAFESTKADLCNPSRTDVLYCTRLVSNGATEQNNLLVQLRGPSGEPIIKDLTSVRLLFPGPDFALPLNNFPLPKQSSLILRGTGNIFNFTPLFMLQGWRKVPLGAIL